MPTVRVPVKADLIRWARERSGIEYSTLAAKFQQLPKWETGQAQPTIKQLEKFARAVHVPFGFLFLSEPPEESIPIADFRSLAHRSAARPSPNLLDMLYTCQLRQDWYHDHLLSIGEGACPFVGSAATAMPHAAVATAMRETLGFSLAGQRGCRTEADAMRLLIRQAEAAGILVMVSSIVLSNTRRPLNLAEFRGFALADPVAPLIFINARDSKAAQMFTLAHELAHIWLGSSALSNVGTAAPGMTFPPKEAWCNATAAEMLVPLNALRDELEPNEPLPDALTRLARLFKVSTLVILRRLLDAQWIERNQFDTEWGRLTTDTEVTANRRTGGGDFYRTTLLRVSRPFACALIVSTLEGYTSLLDACRMLGIKKTETFDGLARECGIMACQST